MLLVIKRCGHCCTYCVKRTLLTPSGIPKQIKKIPMAPPILYQTLESVLEVLNNPKFKDRNDVIELMKIYNDVKQKQQAYEGEAEKHPLVVIEGLDGTGKTTITKKLSNKIDATLFCTPPPIMHSLRNLFDDDVLLRTAYYAMGNYIASWQISQMLKKGPVVLDRFWHSTTAYALAQAVNDNPEENKLPPAGSSVYDWPADLLKPDIVILLTVSEYMRLQRQSRRQTITTQEQLLKSDASFRENVLAAYKNMQNPAVEIINGDPYPNKVVKAILDKISPFLKQ